MWRAEHAGAVAGGGEHRGDHGRRGAFAFGAGDVDDLHAGVGLAEAGEELAHAIELELSRLVGDERGALVVDAGHEPIERGGARGSARVELDCVSEMATFVSWSGQRSRDRSGFTGRGLAQCGTQ